MTKKYFYIFEYMFKYISVSMCVQYARVLCVLGCFCALTTCGDEDENTPKSRDNEHDEELVTTVRLEFQKESEEKKVFTWKSTEKATNQEPSQVDIISLEPNSTYTLNIVPLNETEGHSHEDFRQDIKEEGDIHQIFYLPGEGVEATYTYGDKDSKNLPIGLTGTFTTKEDSKGKLRIVLRHEPAKKSSSGELTDDIGGSTEVDIQFDIEIGDPDPISLNVSVASRADLSSGIQLPYEETDTTLQIMTTGNVTWSATKDMNADWLTLTPSTDQRSLQLDASENMNTTERRENVTISLIRGNISRTITIIQSVNSTKARYELTFTSMWSSSTHPMNFPPSGAHFTTLIGMTHNDQISMWALGRTVGVDADSGMESMAELGGTSGITNYVNNEISNGQAKALLSKGVFGGSSGTTTFEFDVESTHSLVTLVSMLAPSPDWFIGVHDVNLIENGAWITDMTIDLIVYDAGTEQDNIVFDLGNIDQSPKVPISKLTHSSTNFSNGLPKIGTFRLRKM